MNKRNSILESLSEGMLQTANSKEVSILGILLICLLYNIICTFD